MLDVFFKTDTSVGLSFVYFDTMDCNIDFQKREDKYAIDAYIREVSMKLVISNLESMVIPFEQNEDVKTELRKDAESKVRMTVQWALDNQSKYQTVMKALLNVEPFIAALQNELSDIEQATYFAMRSMLFNHIRSEVAKC